MPDKAPSIDSKSRSRIYANAKGWMITPKHFQDIRSSAAIDSTLRRLKAAGIIRQLARGLNDFPAKDPVLGTVDPSADSIARALVVQAAIRLQPSGTNAANMLGFSYQVPSRIVFLTDGPARRIKICKRKIHFQHATPRNIATAGRKSGTLIRALRHLGQDQINDQTLTTLRCQITDGDCPLIQEDLHHAPAWIADFLHTLTAPPR